MNTFAQQLANQLSFNCDRPIDQSELKFSDTQ